MRRTAAAGWPPGGPEHGRWDPGPALAPLRIDLAHLPAPLRYELAYGIDRARRHPDPPVLSNPALHHLIWRLGRTGVGSLLEHEEMRWPRLDGQPGTGPMRVPFLRFTIDRLDELAGRGGHEAEYARDTWRLRRLGYTGDQAGWIYQFEGITQPWLREAAKRFVRWRIAVAHSPSGMSRDVLTLTRLSAALTDIAGPGASVQQLDRVVIERLSSLLTELGVTATGRAIALSSISAFFTAARQHEWLPDLPSQTGVYPEDVPRRPSLPGRAISEFVMTQLEAPASLARLTDPRWALLLPLLMQTGLRLRDALRLAPDCVVRDRQNAPYLRYYNHKMNREALVPISGELADAITARARQLADRFPSGTWLFPQERINRDGLHPITNSVAARALQAWLGDCELRDEQGKPVHVTAHQFRHTLGTRLKVRGIASDATSDVAGDCLSVRERAFWWAAAA